MRSTFPDVRYRPERTRGNGRISGCSVRPPQTDQSGVDPGGTGFKMPFEGRVRRCVRLMGRRYGGSLAG
jgi:hypothetical protein